LSEGYKAYWFDNPKDIVVVLMCHNLDAIASYYLVGFRTLRCGAPCPSGHLTGGYVARSRSHIPGTLGESAFIYTKDNILRRDSYGEGVCIQGRFEVSKKGLWRRIEIKGDQTLADFDHIIRIAFNHDTWNHLSNSL